MYDEETTTKSVIGRLRGFLSGKDEPTPDYQKLDKAGELQKGMWALLPNWSSEIMHRNTVHRVSAIIEGVRHRQEILAPYCFKPYDQVKGTAVVHMVS